MKKFFEEAKDKFLKADGDEQVMIVWGALASLLLAAMIIAFIVMILQELFVPILIGIALYFGGVKFFNWPIPKFVKKLFK